MAREQDTNSQYRYFYTDPLAASWMAKHFGMTFERSDGDLLLDWDDVADDLAIHIASDSWTGKYFIHPDSLYLLEPKLGDVLYSRIGGGVSVEEMLSDERAIQTGPHIIQRGGKIIQRNGKPFHWPESEAV